MAEPQRKLARPATLDDLLAAIELAEPGRPAEERRMLGACYLLEQGDPHDLDAVGAWVKDFRRRNILAGQALLTGDFVRLSGALRFADHPKAPTEAQLRELARRFDTPAAPAAVA